MLREVCDYYVINALLLRSLTAATIFVFLKSQEISEETAVLREPSATTSN